MTHHSTQLDGEISDLLASTGYKPSEEDKVIPFSKFVVGDYEDSDDDYSADCDVSPSIPSSVMTRIKSKTWKPATKKIKKNEKRRHKKSTTTKTKSKSRVLDDISQAGSKIEVRFSDTIDTTDKMLGCAINITNLPDSHVAFILTKLQMFTATVSNPESLTAEEIEERREDIESLCIMFPVLGTWMNTQTELKKILKL